MPSQELRSAQQMQAKLTKQTKIGLCVIAVFLPAAGHLAE
jgi:hypothetical protein